MDLIQAAAAPGLHLRHHVSIRRTDVGLVADYGIPPTHRRSLTRFVTIQASVAWRVDPLIFRELPASSVATAEPGRQVAMGLMLDAWDVAGPGSATRKEPDETPQVPTFARRQQSRAREYFASAIVHGD